MALERSGVTVVHSPEAIDPAEKPSQAIRRARTTSMGMAINAVKEGIADAQRIVNGPRTVMGAGPASDPA